MPVHIAFTRAHLMMIRKVEKPSLEEGLGALPRLLRRSRAGDPTQRDQVARG